jgi:glycosyltransferase involved in cell wall biosynthesis
LWDSYVYADFVTYPSYWEGWGNQFVEAVFARLPILIFEYPVWCSDLKEKGFEVVSLGNTIAGTDENDLVYVEREIVMKCAERIVEILGNPDERQRIVDHNYEIARDSFSMDNLERNVRFLLGNAIGGS